jgi:hypothetical protein
MPTEVEHSYTDWRGRHITKSRTIEDRAIAIPAKAQPVITAGELIQMVTTLRQEMSEAQETFDNQPAIDAERSEQKLELAQRINEIEIQLADARNELAALTKLGSAREQFINSVSTFESRVVAIGNGLYNHMLDKISNQKHDSIYRSLPSTLKEGILFAVNRLGFKGMTQPTFTRIHRLSPDQISNALLDQTMERVYDATIKVEKVLTPEKNK